MLLLIDVVDGEVLLVFSFALAPVAVFFFKTDLFLSSDDRFGSSLNGFMQTGSVGGGVEE
jgi:hypothetical protein